jgi:hypothetical protein
MTTIALRKKIADYLQVADDKKIKAIYTLLENEIEQPDLEYTDELKATLDQRYNDYKNGGKMIAGVAATKQIKKILQSK